MSQSYWQRQTDKPLFPNLLWSRPETKQGAGKLLIIGGQAQEFIHVAESYAAVENAGVGSIRVIMPESTRKITKMLPNIEYATSNASGSFARQAIDELLDTSIWADGVLIAGDLGKNSETNLMLENYISKYNNALFISGEALPSLPIPANMLFNRPDTVLVIGLNDLQKFGIALGLEKPVTSTTRDVELAVILHDLTTKYPLGLGVVNGSNIWTSKSGRVAMTAQKTPISLTTLAANISVWAIQNPSKIHEAITTAAYC